MTQRRRRSGGRKGPRPSEAQDGRVQIRQDGESPAGSAESDDGQERAGFELQAVRAKDKPGWTDAGVQERFSGGEGGAGEAAQDRKPQQGDAVPVAWPRRMIINGRPYMVKNQREADDIAYKQSMGWPV